MLAERAYPRASRIGTAAGTAHGSAYDPDHAYRFGLQRVLDGLAVLVTIAAEVARQHADRRASGHPGVIALTLCTSSQALRVAISSRTKQSRARRVVDRP